MRRRVKDDAPRKEANRSSVPVTEQLRILRKLLRDLRAQQSGRFTHLFAPDRSITGECAGCGGVASNADCHLVGEARPAIIAGRRMLQQDYVFRCPQCGFEEHHTSAVDDHRIERETERGTQATKRLWRKRDEATKD